MKLLFGTLNEEERVLFEMSAEERTLSLAKLMGYDFDVNLSLARFNDISLIIETMMARNINNNVKFKIIIKPNTAEITFCDVLVIEIELGNTLEELKEVLTFLLNLSILKDIKNSRVY